MAFQPEPRLLSIPCSMTTTLRTLPRSYKDTETHQMDVCRRWRPRPCGILALALRTATVVLGNEDPPDGACTTFLPTAPPCGKIFF